MAAMVRTPAGRARLSASDRRAQLVEAALDVFSRQGFRGATTKEIAAQAGVTEAVIFRHFRSKEALYSAVLDSRLASPVRQRRQAEIEALMARDDDEGVVRTLLRNIKDRYAVDPRFQRVVLFAALEGHELGLARVSEKGTPYFRVIRNYIARRQKAGAFAAGDPAILLLAIDGMAHFYGLATRILRMPVAAPADEEAVELLTRLVLHGLSLRGPENRKKKAKR